MAAIGALSERRRVRAIEWMHALLGEGMRTRFYNSPSVRERLSALEEAVGNDRKPALAAALDLLNAAE